MNFCANCGHELGVGRFCTNCGLPVAGRHPAAPAEPAQDAQPTRPEAPAPRVGTLPPPPRFPLYAEPAAAPPYPPRTPRRHTGLLVWAAVLLAVLVIAGTVGVLALISRPGHPSSSGPAARHTASAASPTPTTSGNGSSTSPTTAAGADLTSEVAHVAVPGTAPSSVDLKGHPVSFGAAHLTDGDPESAWRVAGDAQGSVLTITFDRPVTITSLGLINGYAKSYRGYNGYRLNREISTVRWVLDDGTTVEQDLQLEPRMQTVPVSAGPTTTLRLEIGPTVASTTSGGRDYTAISEIALRGSAG